MVLQVKGSSLRGISHVTIWFSSSFTKQNCRFYLKFVILGSERVKFTSKFAKLKLTFCFCTYQNPGVQASASLALAVMSENLSSRDVVGKLGKSSLLFSIVCINTRLQNIFHIRTKTASSGSYVLSFYIFNLVQLSAVEYFQNYSKRNAIFVILLAH